MKNILSNVIEISKAGAPDVLVPAKRNIAPPEAGEIRIKVFAAGINRPDILQRLGVYPPPEGASDIPGLEVAGIVEAVGEGVLKFKRGERVMALVTGGGYAQYCLAPQETCLPIPDTLSFVEAAGFPETFFTVWSNVFQRGQLKPHESFLVHGGTSGIGTTAIMLAKAMGAKIFTTCGSDEKCRFAKKLGADFAINYKTENFSEAILKHTDNKGVDVILDMVAGDYTPQNIACMAADGRLIIIAFLRGSQAQINLVDIMRKRLTITGSTLRPRPLEFKAKIAKELTTQVIPYIKNGTLKPIIHHVFALNQASDAHRMMDTGAHMGKIILDCS